MKTNIRLNTIRLYGHHGVFAEEQQIGSWYEIDIDMLATISQDAYLNDQLDGTVSYADTLDIVKEEFQIKSKLLEHLAYRIAKHVLISSDKIEQVAIRVKKIAPPLVGNIHDACVEMTISNGDISE